MTDQDLTGKEVVAQAHDDSILNREPALARGAVVAIVTALASILVIGGWIDETQKQDLVDNVGILVPALLAIIAIAQAVWTRAAVYSPRTTARVAVANAIAPAGAPPTLLPPP
jgi:hypothetical protein